MYDQLGMIQYRHGNRSSTGGPRNLYRCSDDKWVAVSASALSIALRVLRLVRGEELAGDARYSTPEAREQHAEEVDSLVAHWIRQYPADVVIRKFGGVEAAIGPVYNTAELMEDPQVQARQSVVSVDDPDLGQVRMQNAFPGMSRTPGKIRHAGPTEIGAHNREIYVERLRLTQRDLERLIPNPPKEGVGLASRGGKKVLLCFWDNGFVAKKRPRKRSTR